jgi:hypothetical protein
VGIEPKFRESEEAVEWGEYKGATLASGLTSPGMRNLPGAEPRSGISLFFDPSILGDLLQTLSFKPDEVDAKNGVVMEVRRG